MEPDEGVGCVCEARRAGGVCLLSLPEDEVLKAGNRGMWMSIRHGRDYTEVAR